MRRFFRPIPLAITTVVALSIYALVGFFLLPYIIKSYVFPKASEQLQRPVFAKEVAVNPFTLSLQLTEFEIQEKDSTPFIGFQDFYINVEAISLIRRAYVFDTIRFVIPFVSVKVAKDGLVNLAELIPPSDPSIPPEPPKETETPSEIPAVEIGRFEISQGVVEFLDQSKRKPFSLDIVPINIVLNNFYTKPGGENAYAFTAELGKDKTVSWEGRISVEPIQSEGRLSFRGLSLPILFRYVQENFQFAIAEGTFAADGRYRLDAGISPPNLTLTDASLELADVAIVEQDKPDPVVTLPSLKVDGIQLDLRARNLSIGSFTVADAVWEAWLNADGTVNYQSLFSPVKAESAPPQPASLPSVHTSPTPAKEQPWKVTLKEATLKNHAVHFEDRSLASPMRADITGLTARTHDVKVPLHEPIPLSVELTLNESGKLKTDGQIAVTPFQADLTLGLNRIAIRPFQPYFEKFARVAVDSGDIDLDGRLHVALEHPNAPLLTYRGNFGIRELAISDRDQGLPVASWKHLQLKQIALAVDPTAVTIEEVGLDQPAVRLTKHSDGQLNLSKLRPQPESAAQASAAPARSPKKGAPLSVAVKTVKLLTGSATFVDESIQPTVRTGIHDLTGTVKGLSSKELAKADVEISGRVDKVAPLKISGRINPLTENAFTDLSIKLENVDLTTAAPYSGKFAGYPIRKGKLFLDLAYKVSQKQLEAENKVAIEQFTFGEKTNSPDATSLPVPLAVALLKDRNGRIDIDLPIRGDLSDPDFRYGKVVISALLNLLTKMVASPFALVGSLIPGGGTGEDLQFFEFVPGSAESSAEESKKADALTKALAERPGLRLEITGAADPVRDRQALGLRKLSAELSARWNRDRGKPPTNAEPIPPDEEKRLIRDLYERRQSKAGQSEAALKPGSPARPPTVDEMKQELVAAMPPDEEALRQLAHQRAEAIRNQLTGEGKLPGERVYLVDEDITASEHEKVRSRLAITAS